jgi:hypothetical protein
MNGIPRTKIDAQCVLRTVWGDKPEADFGCVVIDFLSAHADAVHIPFTQFFEIARANQIDDNGVVLNIVNYLTGAHLNLLRTAFEYIDGDTVESLEQAQVRAAKFDKINPLTGDTDEEVGDKIFVYFVPTNLAKEALVK